MTSFDPEADQEQQAKEGTTAPVERPAMGNGSADTAPAAEATDEGETDAADSEQTAAPSEADALAAAQQDAATHYDRFIRLQAEFENYKKRITKEHADSLRYALTPLVTEVAGILDNLERAVDHARKEEDASVGGLLEGIEMVIKQMQEALARFGVTRIEAAGKPFDPALHEAMTVIERDDVPDNHVLDEFQAGYLLHDRVVRPARVSVSRRPEVDGGVNAAPPGAPVGET